MKIPRGILPELPTALEIAAVEFERCPACGAPTVITGHVTGGRSVPAGIFVPDNVRLLRWSEGVPLNGAGFRCCASCGHLWASLNAEELRAFVVAYGDELAKQDTDPIGTEAGGGSPNSPDARRASQGVTEIDALVREGKRTEATRRYRELTGGTWDQAIDANRTWRDLTRGQKLALLGWRPKDTPQGTGKGEFDHPMHDPLLDG